MTKGTGAVAAVSPHLDDGVFGCGALLAEHPGSSVITVLAGGPGPREEVTPWDAACGFGPGDDVIAARRAEDREALSVLGATPVWLDLADAQYGPSPSVAEVRRALDDILVPLAPRLVLVPLGLFHSDHILVASAAIDLLRARPEPIYCAYEDAIYRRTGGLTDRALRRLSRAAIAAVRVDLQASAAAFERKRLAVHCYRSQLRGLASAGRPGHEDVFAPERYFHLSRVAGEERT